MNVNLEKLNGLIPAIIQDARTSAVLMLGYMNKAAYQKTRKTKRVTFYSRSKKRLWTKGETSGNYLELVEIKPDCDGDALLIKALPKGATCHTGEYSCFGEQENSLQFLQFLYALIKERKEKLPPNSYTASLFKAGMPRILAKVQEEAQEVIQAVKKEGRGRVVEEVADLVYHLMALIAACEITLEEVAQCLQDRNSGFEYGKDAKGESQFGSYGNYF